MKNIKIRCCCEAIFEKEVIINDKNMSEKQLKEIIDEAKNNFIDEVESDLYYQRRKKSFNLTLYDFFTMLADTAQEERDNERKFQESEEYFSEHADINEYLFYKNGEKYQ